jgi:hypothetical protein
MKHRPAFLFIVADSASASWLDQHGGGKPVFLKPLKPGARKLPGARATAMPLTESQTDLLGRSLGPF